jgi:hypothetical protein
MTGPTGPSSPWYSNGWVIGPVCLIVGLLAGLGIGAAVGGGDSDEASTQTPTTVVVTSTAAPTGPTTAADPTTAPMTAPTTEPTTESTPSDEPASGGTADAPLPLGQAAQVGKSYTVAVLDVIANANDMVAGANMFNDPPKGQYVVVQIKTMYVGNKEGDPWIDLSFRYVGTDARQYAEYDCGAVLPHDSGDVPTLEHGGKATFQICFDMPPKAIQGGQLFVEDSLSFSGRGRVYWATR